VGGGRWAVFLSVSSFLPQLFLFLFLLVLFFLSAGGTPQKTHPRPLEILFLFIVRSRTPAPPPAPPPPEERRSRAQAAAMQNDDIIWHVLNNQHCSYKAKYVILIWPHLGIPHFAEISGFRIITTTTQH
jgi:hypothetical protein